MHTKEMIMEGLQELHDSYNVVIANYNYRSSMKKYPTFTIKQLAEQIGRTEATTRKWCHVLREEKLVLMSYGRCYSANDSMTYQIRRADAQLVQLRHKTCEERQAEDDEWERLARGK